MPKRVCQLPEEKPDKCECCDLGGHKMVCTQGVHWATCIANAMLLKLMQWCNEALAHIEGISRLEETLKGHFCHPKLSRKVKCQVAFGDICQHIKR